MARDRQFHLDQESVLKNLEELQISLNACVSEGMIDLDDGYYNELLGLIEDARISKGKDQLKEAIDRARSLEIEMAAWLAHQGKTTVSRLWPKI